MLLINSRNDNNNNNNNNNKNNNSNDSNDNNNNINKYLEFKSVIIHFRLAKSLEFQFLYNKIIIKVVFDTWNSIPRKYPGIFLQLKYLLLSEIYSDGKYLTVHHL